MCLFAVLSVSTCHWRLSHCLHYSCLYILWWLVPVIGVCHTIVIILICCTNFCCRYFTCSPLYGLFAPVGKVVPQPAASVVAAIPAASSLLRRPSAHSIPHSAATEPLHGATTTANERSGSQESLSSVSSVTSSASRSRVRLGISSTAAGSGKVRAVKTLSFLVFWSIRQLLLGEAVALKTGFLNSNLLVFYPFKNAVSRVQWTLLTL